MLNQLLRRDRSQKHTRCVRVDCIPVGSDDVKITPDTITIERSKCNMCFCGCKKLSDTASSNIETYRARWMHVQVPLIPLHWVTAYLIEGIMVYCLVSFLGAILVSDFSEKDEEMRAMQWSFEKVVAIQELWFGGNLLVGMVACVVWWGLRILWQINSRHGHAYVYATGSVTPPGGMLGDADNTEGRFAVKWADCEKLVDEFLTHKGCYMRDKKIVEEKKKAEKKSELLKVLTGAGERLAEFQMAEFKVEGLKALPGTEMGEDVLGIITKQAMAKALQADPEQQVKNLVDMLLEPALRKRKDAGMETLRAKQKSYEDLPLEKLVVRLGKKSWAKDPAVLAKSGDDEADEVYKKRLVALAMEPKERKIGWRLDPTAAPRLEGETEEDWRKRIELPIEDSQYAMEQKKLEERLDRAVGVSRSEQFLGKVRLDEYARAAHLHPVYSEGHWNANPGGRWYVWKRWWLGEETSLFIGEHTFKAGSVMHFGPFCRRREHLAAHTMDLVWVHAGKKGRSLGRILRWTWDVVKMLTCFSLAVAIMWSINFPDCHERVGCEHLQPLDNIDYGNCEAECIQTACSNLTCVRFSTCDDIVISNFTATQDVADMCSAATDALDQAESYNNYTADFVSQLSEAERNLVCVSATDAAERARTAIQNLPASCGVIYDEEERAKAYKLYLDVTYVGQDGAWLGPVAHLGGENCALAAAVDKCSACKGRERCSRETVGEMYQLETHVGEGITAKHFPFDREGMYPSDFELCSAIAESGQLSDSEFCPNVTFTSDWEMATKPCICSAWWEKLVPTKAVFYLTFVVSFAISSFGLIYVWLRWVPEVVDFGLGGMQYNASTAGFVLPPGESVMASIDLLETKIGRELSLHTVHDPWVYTPSVIRYPGLAVKGFEESMTVYEDFVHVSVHSGVPLCCSKRLCGPCSRTEREKQEARRKRTEDAQEAKKRADEYNAKRADGEGADDRGDSKSRVRELCLSAQRKKAQCSLDCMELSTRFSSTAPGRCCGSISSNTSRCCWSIGQSCCCDPHGVWADEDNYFLLLENVTFIEVGSEFFWLFDDLSWLFSRLSIFFLVVEYAFMEPLQAFQDVIENLKLDEWKREDSIVMWIWEERYNISAVCFILYIWFKILSGNVWKRGYVSLHCLPGGTARGRKSKLVGRSPFFVHLMHPDPDKFREDIETIRAAVRKTRMEVTMRHKERLSQMWSSAVFASSEGNSNVSRFRDKMVAVVSREGGDTDNVTVNTGRVGQFNKSGFNMNRGMRQPTLKEVELNLGELYLEFFEKLNETEAEQLDDVTKEPEPEPEQQLESETEPAPESSFDLSVDVLSRKAERAAEAAARVARRKRNTPDGQIDLRSVIAVRLVEQTPEEQEVSAREFFGDSSSDIKVLHVVVADGDGWKFTFEDSEEQENWQGILESAVQAAQTTFPGTRADEFSTFTRFLNQREEDKIVSEFAKEGAKEGEEDLSSTRAQVARIFCAIDTNHDRSISFKELTTWLSGAKQHKDDDKAKEAIESIQKKYEDANKDHHSIRMTLDEFWELMHDGGVVQELKNAHLWKRLAFEHVFDGKALGQMFDHAVALNGTSGGSFIDVGGLQWCFAQLGTEPPPASDIHKQLRAFDRTVKEKLSKSQFIELMMEHIHSGHLKKEFQAGLWYDGKVFGMVLDILPWGVQVTTIDHEECVTRGREGPFATAGEGYLAPRCKKHCGCTIKFTKAFTTAWEMSRARWLHSQGNPLDLHRLAGYLAEALLIYAFIASDYVQGEIVSAKFNLLGPICCGYFWGAAFTALSWQKNVAFYLSLIPAQVSYLWLNWLIAAAGFWWVYPDPDTVYGGAFSWVCAHYLVRLFAIQWWALRVFLLMFRKMGTANMFVLGQPMHKQNSRSRQQFPVQISSLRDLSDTFLQVKGFDAMDKRETYREMVPGFSFIPHDLDQCQCCGNFGGCSRWYTTKFCGKTSCLRHSIMLPLQRCRGIHSINIGQKHFEIERNSGGGWKAASKRVSGWRARCTRMDHVAGYMDDVKWVHVKKDGLAITDLVNDSLFAVFAVLILATPIALLASYPCSDLLNLRGRDVPSPSALQRNPNSLTWSKWATFNSTAAQMERFDGAQQWCDAFDTSAQWFQAIEPSIVKTKRPCVCPLKPGEICNPNLDPSLYFRSLGQPNWCSAWEQGTEFHYPDSQTPHEPTATTVFGLSNQRAYRGWPWQPPSPPLEETPNYLDIDSDWSESEDNHFAHDPTLHAPVYSNAEDIGNLIEHETNKQGQELVGDSTADALFEETQEGQVLETERDYRSRDQPCECLTPMSTAFPSIYIVKWIVMVFLSLVEPLIVLHWLKYQSWYCQLGVAGLGEIGTCCLAPHNAMHRVFKRRHTVELSQNIQRLNELLFKSKEEEGCLLSHGLDNSTLLIVDLPEVLWEDDNMNRKNPVLAMMFKRGHRAEFLAATLYEQQGQIEGYGKPGGWGAIVTIRDSTWVNQVVHRRQIQVEKDPKTGAYIMVLKQRDERHSKNSSYFVTVRPFPKPDDPSKDKILRGTIKDFDVVKDIHYDETLDKYQKLHAGENKHASMYRNMSAHDQANSLFRTIDQDSNGFISDAELDSLIQNEKVRREETLYTLLKALEQPRTDGQQVIKNPKAEIFSKILLKDVGDITDDDYVRVFERYPDKELHAHDRAMQEHVREEAEVWKILSETDEGTMSPEDRKKVFARLPNGQLRQVVLARLGLFRLKKTVKDECTVRDADRRALKRECQRKAKVDAAQRLSVLSDKDKQELDEQKAKEKEARKKVKAAEKARAAEEKAKLDAEMAELKEEQARTDHQSARVLWKLAHKNEEAEEIKAEAAMEREEEVQAEAAEEDAKRIQDEAERSGNADDANRWALLRTRLEDSSMELFLAQGLVDILTLPGWVEAVLELIMERMKHPLSHDLVDVTADSLLSIEDQLARSKHTLRELANGGVAAAEEISDKANARCCGSAGEDDITDQDAIDQKTAVEEARVHQLQAQIQKQELEEYMALSTQTEEQAKEDERDKKLLEAEEERADPVRAITELGEGKRVIKAQFRRWFLELLGGEEHSQYGLPEPSDWTFDAIEEVEKLYGTLMSPPDVPQLMDIDPLAKEAAEESHEYPVKVDGKKGIVAFTDAGLQLFIEKDRMHVPEKMYTFQSLRGCTTDAQGFALETAEGEVRSFTTSKRDAQEICKKVDSTQKAATTEDM